MKHKLEINFSIAAEIKRVQYTVANLSWYEKQGYFVYLPIKIRGTAHLEKKLTIGDITEAVSNEFDKNIYTNKVCELKFKWRKANQNFFKKLTTMGLPLQSKYKVSLTRYGTGGSYGLPNNIQINFYANARDIASTTFHEIIHLTIERLIKKYKIEHWTKERLVDLVYGRIFPKERRLQRDPKNAKTIRAIFERFYPNISKVIREVNALSVLPSKI